ncbi:hypothetical protein ACZ91_67400, partial [Streptomyces regensis]
MENVRHMNRGEAGPRGLEPASEDDIDNERTVLATAITHPRYIPEIRALITGSDFYRPAHETIWDALTDLYDHGQPTTVDTLMRALDD